MWHKTLIVNLKSAARISQGLNCVHLPVIRKKALKFGMTLRNILITGYSRQSGLSEDKLMYI